jgi:glycogen debranching enzyme
VADRAIHRRVARVYPDRDEELRSFSVGLLQHLANACIGSISEIFDAEPPYTLHGCCAQAWSVAEVLRLLTVTGSMLREHKAA